MVFGIIGSIHMEVLAIIAAAGQDGKEFVRLPYLCTKKTADTKNEKAEHSL